MKVTGLGWRAFRVPFRRRFATSRQVLAYREGVILQLRTDVGIVGLGEAAPIPGSRQNALQEVLGILDAVAPCLLGRQVDDIGGALDLPGQDREPDAVAAVRCALDVASCDATARVLGLPVATFLMPGASRSVPVNATIAAPDTATAEAAAAEARIAGFACVKLKVGMAGSIEAECARVAAVRDALGPVRRLRLDANGTWTVEQAIRTIQALECYHLELVEQPVAPGHLAGLKQVRTAVRTPIAADEEVTGVEAARRVLHAGAAQVLVVKPMMVGGLRPARRIVELAAAADASVVVTTTLDAGVATAAALHLAATLPPGGLACGLATGSLLCAGLITMPLAARDGCMELPPAPGLGVELDEQELVQYGGTPHDVP